LGVFRNFYLVKFKNLLKFILQKLQTKKVTVLQEISYNENNKNFPQQFPLFSLAKTPILILTKNALTTAIFVCTAPLVISVFGCLAKGVFCGMFVERREGRLLWFLAWKGLIN
jgi:hypothetical protein